MKRLKEASAIQQPQLVRNPLVRVYYERSRPISRPDEIESDAPHVG